MSNIKERIFGAVTVMSEEDAQKVWDLILSTFALDNIEQIVPDPDEQAAMDAYKNGNPDYQPSVSQEDLLKELNYFLFVFLQNPCLQRSHDFALGSIEQFILCRNSNRLWFACIVLDEEVFGIFALSYRYGNAFRNEFNW